MRFYASLHENLFLLLDGGDALGWFDWVCMLSATMRDAWRGWLRLELEVINQVGGCEAGWTRLEGAGLWREFYACTCICLWTSAELDDRRACVGEWMGGKVVAGFGRSTDLVGI